MRSQHVRGKASAALCSSKSVMSKPGAARAVRSPARGGPGWPRPCGDTARLQGPAGVALTCRAQAHCGACRGGSGSVAVTGPNCASQRLCDGDTHVARRHWTRGAGVWGALADYGPHQGGARLRAEHDVVAGRHRQQRARGRLRRRARRAALRLVVHPARARCVAQSFKNRIRFRLTCKDA